MPLPESPEFRVTKTAPLTAREAEVLLWTAEGKTAWETGRILGITEGTTRAHLAHALGKLRAANKAHAVARAFSCGLISRKIVAAALVVGSFISPPPSQAARLPRPPLMRAGMRLGRLTCRIEGLLLADPRRIAAA